MVVKQIRNAVQQVDLYSRSMFIVRTSAQTGSRPFTRTFSS